MVRNVPLAGTGVSGDNGFPMLSMFHSSTSVGVGLPNTARLLTYIGAPPAIMYTAPMLVSISVPLVGTGLSVANSCGVITV